ncbi:MAG TPA: sigma-70 family RNA polymerase sigma factor [Gemmataceae bacterium]|nr:sigma-70 family RNA polymerase sigma factor [Gemmataceae bacterium]
MRRWQQGDAAAFEVLVRRWQQPVARFLARIGQHPGLVPDLCQEVFLRLYLAGPRYREAGAFSTWLYRIALNAARDAGRRRRHEPLPLRHHEPAAETATAETVCEQQELARSVAEAVAELPQPLREVLVLRHYEEMSFEQMAGLLGAPASTLKSRFSAALGRLRLRLQHLGWSHEETP